MDKENYLHYLQGHRGEFAQIQPSLLLQRQKHHR